jgi:hypothetical protein
MTRPAPNTRQDLPQVKPYTADRSLRGKLRRRLALFSQPRLVTFKLDRPMLSVSFDDAALSAATDGARLLEGVGARGTYYVASSLCGRQAPIETSGASSPPATRSAATR